MATAAARPVDDQAVSEAEARGLRRYNVVVGLVHLVQAIAMLVLSTDFSLPVTRTVPAGPPGTPPITEGWFDVPLGPAVAAFLFLAAIDHLLMAAPGINGWYNHMLGERKNYARWIEYSVSASLMIVLIAMITSITDIGALVAIFGVNTAMITSITDIGALVAIFGVNTAMILFGLLQEMFVRPQTGRVNWWPYLFGCFAGAVPWIVIALSVWFSETSSQSAGGPPGFVYGIIVSLFLFFNTFSVNMVLQYKGVGKWRSYLFGERAYIFFSLVAKSLLAWQVFANVLVG